MNIHNLDQDELAEVFHDAALQYVASGDRTGYTVRLLRLGIVASEINENLRELDITRAEKFNHALAQMQGRHKNGKAA